MLCCTSSLLPEPFIVACNQISLKFILYSVYGVQVLSLELGISDFVQEQVHISRPKQVLRVANAIQNLHHWLCQLFKTRQVKSIKE